MARNTLLFVLAAALFPSAVSAQVVISEIMYDLESGSDSGREWVEVFNTGGSTVTLTEWKLFENGTNHALTAYSGSEEIPSGAYAIIADNPANFLADNPGFSGSVFDSAFSLSNTGETLILRCCGSDLLDKDSVTYSSAMGAQGDGKTLQRSSGGSFSALAPTPGSGALVADASQTTETTLSESENTAPNAGAGGGAASGAKPPPPPVPLYANAGADSIGIAGAPLSFVGEAYDAKKALVEDAYFGWNFGDGVSGEGKIIEHTYEYAGKYVVTLTTIKHERSATDTLIVTIEEPRMEFAVREDGSIALTNRGARAVDISLWRIEENQHVFVFPRGTQVLPNTTLRVSPKRLSFFASPNTIVLFPDGVVALRVVTEPVLLVEEEPPARAVSPYVSPQRAVTPTPAQNVNLPDEVSDTGASTSPFTASAASSVSGNFFSPWFFGALFIGIFGAGAVFLIRRMEGREWTIIEGIDEKSV